MLSMVDIAYPISSCCNVLSSGNEIEINERELLMSGGGVIWPGHVPVLAEALFQSTESMPKAQLMLQHGPGVTHGIDF